MKPLLSEGDGSNCRASRVPFSNGTARMSNAGQRDSTSVIASVFTSASSLAEPAAKLTRQHCATARAASTVLDVCSLRAARLASLRPLAARGAQHQGRVCLLQPAAWQGGATKQRIYYGPPRPRKKTTRSPVAAAQLWNWSEARHEADLDRPRLLLANNKIKYNKRAMRDDGSIRLGKAWGTLHWRGTPVGRPDRRVPGHSKAMWQLFGDAPPPATDADRPHLTKRLHKKYYVVVDD